MTIFQIYIPGKVRVHVDMLWAYLSLMRKCIYDRIVLNNKLITVIEKLSKVTYWLSDVVEVEKSSLTCFLAPLERTEPNAMLYCFQIFTGTCEVAMQVKQLTRWSMHYIIDKLLRKFAYMCMCVEFLHHMLSKCYKILRRDIDEECSAPEWP